VQVRCSRKDPWRKEATAYVYPLYQQRSPLVSKKPGGATDEQ